MYGCLLSWTLMISPSFILFFFYFPFPRIIGLKKGKPNQLWELLLSKKKLITYSAIFTNAIININCNNKRKKRNKKSTPLSSEVLNDSERLCSELLQQKTNQSRQCTFVPPVNLLYQTAVNVSVNQVIKPRHFVCFISWLIGMGNSDTHTHTQE